MKTKLRLEELESRLVPSLAQPLFEVAAPATGPYTPQQIRHAYGFDQLNNTGLGETIYIIDAFDNPKVASDLHTFDLNFGLSDPNLTVKKMKGNISTNAAWDIESSLDVEWAHVIAPQSNIVLVEAQDNTISGLMKAVDYASKAGNIISMSWGFVDYAGDINNDNHFNHPGIAYIAAAGDTRGVAMYPATSSYILSVGGTTLPLDSNGNRVNTETAWLEGGSGPAISEKEPFYQTNYGITISNGMRGTPDVAYDADPNTGVWVYSQLGGGWMNIGGTSIGAPQWAGLVALADQSRTIPLSTTNLTSRFEYNAAAPAIYGSNFNDITFGFNYYSSLVGYDMATGLGTPWANNLVPSLSTQISPLATTQIETQFQTVSLKKTDWKTSLLFSGFDPSQGTLVGVTIQLTEWVNVQGNGSTVNDSVQINAQLPTGTVDIVTNVQGVVGDLWNSNQEIITLTDPTNLAAFTTRNFISIPVNTITTLQGGKGHITTYASLQLAIKYEYIP